MISNYLAADSRDFAVLFPAGAPLTRLATGFLWAEGPVWFSELNELRFSDIPNNRMMRWSPVAGLSVFPAHANTGDPNGPSPVNHRPWWRTIASG